MRPIPGNAHEEHLRRATVADVSTGRVLGILVVAAVASGCATVVTGTGRAAPEPVVDAPTTSVAPTTDPAPTGAAPPPGPRPALAADVLADECLLDALGFSDLLGVPVLPPRQAEVRRDDGSVGSSCVATSARGPADPLASVNVYEPRDATPAEFVRSAPAQGTTELAGVGEAAALLDTAPGVTLQLAGTRFVVTISVSDGAPSHEAWRAAATAVLAALRA